MTEVVSIDRLIHLLRQYQRGTSVSVIAKRMGIPKEDLALLIAQKPGYFIFEKHPNGTWIRLEE